MDALFNRWKRLTTFDAHSDEFYSNLKVRDSILFYFLSISKQIFNVEKLFHLNYVYFRCVLYRCLKPNEFAFLELFWWNSIDARCFGIFIVNRNEDREKYHRQNFDQVLNHYIRTTMHSCGWYLFFESDVSHVAC